MEFRFLPMNPQYAHEIAHWHYPGIYAFYDLDQDPEDLEEFLNPNNWEKLKYAVVNEHYELIGFFSFYQEADTVILGLGLHPEYTGKGFGGVFVQAGIDFGNQVFQPSTFRLSVAMFNRRAIRVYEHLGFTAEKVFMQQTNGGQYEFLQMSKPASDKEKEIVP